MLFLILSFVLAISMSTVAFAAEVSPTATSTTATARSNSGDVATIVTGNGETETIVGYYSSLQGGRSMK